MRDRTSFMPKNVYKLRVSREFPSYGTPMNNMDLRKWDGRSTFQGLVIRSLYLRIVYNVLQLSWKLSAARKVKMKPVHQFGFPRVIGSCRISTTVRVNEP